MNNPQIQYPEAQPGIQPGVLRKPDRPYQYPESLQRPCKCPESLQPGEMLVNPKYVLFPTYTYGGIKPEALAFLIFVTLLSLATWLWILWRLASKAGYRGRSRWIWFAFLAFPLTGGIALITFCLIPYPIQKQLDSRNC
jgi:hypothetical protein